MGPIVRDHGEIEPPENFSISPATASKKKISVPLIQERESTLTVIFRTNSHIKSAYNIIASHFVIFFVTCLLQYILDWKELQEDGKYLRWVFQKFYIVVAIELFFVLWSFCQWVLFRRSTETNAKYWTIQLVMIAAYVYVPIYLTAKYKINLISAFAMAMEQNRVAMKMFAITFENLQIPPGNRATFSQFIYFWFAPTLIYRPTYPRSKTRSWSLVINYFCQFLACVFMLFAFVRRFVQYQFAHSVDQPLHINELPRLLFTCILVGTCLLFLGWYGLLHCWLNAWAEAMRFGDRFFYDSWWLSSSYTEYYRQWNRIVHVWLHEYVYGPLNKKYGPATGVISTIFISSMFHEYIISFALGHFFPLISIFYLTVGVWLYFATKHLTGKNVTLMNSFIQFSLCASYGIWLFAFSLESYSRIHCPSTNDNPISDFFVPRSLSCIKFI
ncbi:sterol O-acyltransferase 1-like [Brevipalpus obovatus]|uniref:sterol O-acyltransferase 1-like n=1 Tax=Brevipalpus obovatus TaxID=246614 RepID=UPI003D9F908A